MLVAARNKAANLVCSLPHMVVKYQPKFGTSARGYKQTLTYAFDVDLQSVDVRNLAYFFNTSDPRSMT